MDKYIKEQNKHRDDLRKFDDENLRDIYMGALELILERAEAMCMKHLEDRPDIKEMVDKCSHDRYVFSLFKMIEQLSREVGCLGIPDEKL